MTNETALLQMYVSDNEYSPAIQVPFRHGGKVCATDGRMMIRIDKSLCEQEYTSRPNGLKAPNTDSVIPKPNMCETITAYMLNKALEKAPEEKDRRCPECNGEGSVVYIYRDRHNEKHEIYGDCPECDGEGDVSDYTAIKYHFTLHGHALTYKHLKMLLRTMDYLQIISLRLRHIQKDDNDTQVLLFDVEGKDIDILAMPQLRDTRLTEIKIID